MMNASTCLHVWVHVGMYVQNPVTAEVIISSLWPQGPPVCSRGPPSLDFRPDFKEALVLSSFPFPAADQKIK